MAAVYEVEVAAGAEEVYYYLAEKMAHVTRVSADAVAGEGIFVAVLLYEHFFMRVGNQATLMVLVESLGPERTRVKTVGCGTSKGMFIKVDWGAGDAFAWEPIKYLRQKYQVDNC